MNPAFIQLFQQYSCETERQARVALYQKLAERALAPVGVLWPKTFTSVSLDTAQWTMDDVRAGLAFWDSPVQDRVEQEKSC